MKCIFFVEKMPKHQKESDSDSEKSRNDGNVSGSGSDGEEEEYVVEKVVDKRIKAGKVISLIFSARALPLHGVFTFPYAAHTD